jgi:hypothetical protein
MPERLTAKWGVVRVGKSNASRLHKKPELLGIGQRRFLSGSRRCTYESSSFLRGNYRFVECSIWQTNSALESPSERACRFQNNRHIEVSRQTHLLAYRKFRVIIY